MQSESDKRKLKWFIGGLIVVALIINGVVASRFHRNPPLERIAARDASAGRRDSEPSLRAQSAAQEVAVRERKAAEDHASELARYVNTPSRRAAGTKAMTIAIATEDGTINRTLIEKFSSKFKGAPVEILPDFFNSEFAADGLLREAMTDAVPVARRLELAKHLDLLFLGQQVVNYTTNRNLEGVISAHMELQLVAVNLGNGKQTPVLSYRADGPGFSPREARSAAEGRILKQIDNDPAPQF